MPHPAVLGGVFEDVPQANRRIILRSVPLLVAHTRTAFRFLPAKSGMILLLVLVLVHRLALLYPQDAAMLCRPRPRASHKGGRHAHAAVVRQVATCLLLPGVLCVQDLPVGGGDVHEREGLVALAQRAQ